jgi:hypothetical protein
LTDYESSGHIEVYRYAAGAPAGKRLACISCNPTGIAATSDAQLQSDFGRDLVESLPPLNELAPVANLTTDGSKAFFQSGERLASADLDGKIDVYEWEALGTGGCGRESGCVRLISAGHSASDDYLYGVTPSGNDVFFESGDELVFADQDPTPSIYDARAPHVPGEAVGFDEGPSASAPCQIEVCQGPSPDQPGPLNPPSANLRGGFEALPRCHRARQGARVKGHPRCRHRHRDKRKKRHGGKRHGHVHRHSHRRAGR